MIVVDTTVLVYAVGEEHPLREPCRQIVRAVQSGSIEAHTTVEVIQEFAHVRSQRRGRNDGSALAQEFAGLLQPLIALDELDLHTGLELFRRQERLGAFDCLLASATLRRDAEALVSADRAFADVDRLVVWQPTDPTLVERLFT